MKIKVPSTKYFVDSGAVEQEDEDAGFKENPSKHMLVESWKSEWNLNREFVTFLDLQAKTLDHWTMTMVTK